MERWRGRELDTGNHSLVKHVFLADLVGDAAPDLLVSAGVTSVYENQNCQGGGWDPSETLSMYMTNAVFGDLDGNGTTDIAAIDEPFDEMAVWLDLGTWTRFDVSTTIDAPFRIAKSDFDFDGDFDLVTTAYTDEELVWWENDGTGAGWTGHLIASIPHPAVLAVGDLDLDGVPEIVSGNWSADEIHIFENRGGQYRTSYQDVAPASVGESEVAVLLKAEFNIHGRSGDPDVELYRVLLEISDGSWNPLTIQQGEDLFDSFKVWHDENGNGVFDPGSDPEIASRPPVLSAEGRISVLVDSGSANPNIPGTGAGTFFVGVEMAFDAGAHDPGDFRVTAYSSPYSTIAYATHPHIRLRGEPWSAAQIGPVSIVDDGLFADGFESGDDSRWTSASP